MLIHQTDESLVEKEFVIKATAAKQVEKKVAFSLHGPLQLNNNKKQQQRKRKLKNKKINNEEQVDTEGLLQVLGGMDKLLAAICHLPLTIAELQTLVEVLLNRQQEETIKADSEWMNGTGRLDPIGALRKQLEQKDRLIQAEIEDKLIYQNKVRVSYAR